MGRLTILALLLGSLLGCNEKGGPDPSPSQGSAPSVQPGQPSTAPDYIGHWDSVGNNVGSGCAGIHPYTVTSEGSNAIGLTFIVDASKGVVCGQVTADQFSFDGAYVYDNTTGYAWPWTQISHDEMRLDYGSNCYQLYSRKTGT